MVSNVTARAGFVLVSTCLTGPVLFGVVLSREVAMDGLQWMRVASTPTGRAVSGVLRRWLQIREVHSSEILLSAFRMYSLAQYRTREAVELYISRAGGLAVASKLVLL